MGTGSEGDRSSVATSSGFAIGAEFDPPRMTLAPRGELDLASAPLLGQEMDALPWPELGELVFDLAELTFIDSTGLSALIRAHQRAVKSGVRVSVVRVPSQPMKLFTIAGVTESLNVQP